MKAREISFLTECFDLMWENLLNDDFVENISGVNTAPDASMNSDVEKDKSSHGKNTNENQSSPVDVESKISKSFIESKLALYDWKF